MNIRTAAQLLAISGVGLCLAAVPGLADARNCRHVGGGILTNFLQPASCAGSFDNLCSDGTATGDLQGAIGVSVLGISGNVYHVRHHWVTAAGDTIFLKDAYLTTYPTSDANRVLSDYPNGVQIDTDNGGGTGAFAGAKGEFNSVFGAIDLKKGQLTLRYEGTVCFAPVSAP